MIKIDKGNMNAVIFKGNSGNINVKYSDKDLVEGDTVYLTVKNAVEDTEAILELSSTTIEDDGSCNIVIEAADTADLEVGTYLYDITIECADGQVDTLIVNEKLPTFEVKASPKSGV